MLEFYGSLDKFELLRSSASRDAILLMLITSGVAHLPPMKVVTILSGAAAVDIWLFIASAIVARGGKFFAIAWLLRRYGEPIREFIEKRLGLSRSAGVVALILFYFAFRALFQAVHLTSGVPRAQHMCFNMLAFWPLRPRRGMFRIVQMIAPSVSSSASPLRYTCPEPESLFLILAMPSRHIPAVFEDRRRAAAISRLSAMRKERDVVSQGSQVRGSALVSLRLLRRAGAADANRRCPAADRAAVLSPEPAVLR